MEDICASAGSSSHQHGDCASVGSSSHQHGDRPYPRWTGARLRSSRSLPGRLSGGARLRSSRSLPGRLSEIMAPLKWPGPVLDYFVDECFKMVQDGRSPADENPFFKTLERSMSRQSFGTTYCKMDLIQQFRRVKSLWDKYHEILKNLEIIKVCTSPEHVTVFELEKTKEEYTKVKKNDIISPQRLDGPWLGRARPKLSPLPPFCNL